MTSAAFRATYSDWKVVKGRKVVQVVLEMPLETADTAYQVLGGMPSPAAEVWCAVARLSDGGSSNEDSRLNSTAMQVATPAPPATDKPAKSPAQVAGYLCTLGSFQAFLKERFPQIWRDAFAFKLAGEMSQDEAAAWCVRDICGVQSRADLTDKNVEWNALQLAFKLWQTEAEVVPA